MSKRRRARLQRLTHSVVVTFSAAAAGSAGCDVLSHPPPNAGITVIGTAGVGGVFGPGGAGSMGGLGPPSAMDAPVTMTPSGAINPPVPLPCPSTLPTAGASCVRYYTAAVTPSSADGCTIPAVNDCGQEYTARCVGGVWVVELGQYIACNPPDDAGMGIEDDAGLDDDGGLDVEG